jgi:hypothetical protein
MKRYYFTLILLAFLLSFKGELKAQRNEDNLKSSEKFEKYLFTDEEMLVMRRNSVTTYTEKEKNELGLIDFQTIRYDFYTRPGAEFTQLLFVSFMIFSNKESMNKKLASLDKEEMFTPHITHTFLIDGTTLIYFYLGAYRIGDKYDSAAYLNLLNKYRTRLDAKLILPKNSGYNEKSYFIRWNLDVI